MKRILIILLFFTILFNAISAEDTDTLLDAYLKNFTRGSIATKIQVLQDASQIESEDMGRLYHQAVDFILNNSQQLKTDIMAEELSILAIRLIGLVEYTTPLHSLWRLFEADNSTYVRVEIMNTLSIIAPGDDRTILNINDWLTKQNEIWNEKGYVDKLVVRETVAALGVLRDKRSFPVVFSTSILNYSDDITYKAQESLKKIDGEYKELIIQVILKSQPVEKFAALTASFSNESLSNEDKGEIGVTALEIGLYTSTSSEEERQVLRELRYYAVRRLTSLKWSRAASEVIRHFDTTLLEYDRGLTSKENLLEAIECLGAMGTHEAAVRITLYLELLNSFVENGQVPDEQIAYAIVTNLGLLGDKIAFDYLLYTGYLDYPASVKRAAKEALNNLKR